MSNQTAYRSRKSLTEGCRAPVRAWHINPPHTRTKEALQNCHRVGYHSRTTSLMDYVRKIDFQSIRVLVYVLLAHTFLVAATFNGFICCINVEQLEGCTTQSSKPLSLYYPHTSRSRLSPSTPQCLAVDASGCTGDAPWISSQTTNWCGPPSRWGAA
jgi:hypothetical protein